MSILPQHPYLHTRIGLLAARLVPVERLQALVKMSLEPETALDSNQRLSLEQILSGQIHHHEQLEHSLFADILDDFQVLVRPLEHAERRFLVYWLRRLEINNIKLILRAKMTGLSNQQIRDKLINLQQFTHLPIDDLLRAEDSAEMLRRLEVIPAFADIARQASQVYEQQRELFALEATIDHRYYAGVVGRAQAVRSEHERKPLLALVGQLLERVNLMWLLRYRFTYHLSAAETYYLLIPGQSQRLLGADVADLVQQPTLEAVIQALKPEVRQSLESYQSLVDIEQYLEHLVRQEARKMLRHSASALTRAFAYMLLRECEVRQILAIAKGRQLQLDADLIHEAAGFKLALMH